MTDNESFQVQEVTETLKLMVKRQVLQSVFDKAYRLQTSKKNPSEQQI